MNLPETYWTDRKTRALMRLLGKGAEVLPLRLWSHVSGRHGADGRLAGYKPQEMEDAAGWWGEPGKFVAAMLEVGWLEPLPDGQPGYQCHEWEQHQRDHAGDVQRTLGLVVDYIKAANEESARCRGELLEARDREIAWLKGELARERQRTAARERQQRHRDKAVTATGQACDSGRDTAPSKLEAREARKDEITKVSNFENGTSAEKATTAKASGGGWPPR
jgi:hypothetical protein